MSDALEKACECNQLPDACTNDIREEKLIKRQQKKDGRPFVQRIISRDRNLLIACAALILMMNISTGRYILYPFRIFATWIHEMCHGLAALLVGGRISKLEIFKDGSGLAYTSTYKTWHRGFVASGGYPGTAVTGCILLLFRRTTLGPTIGTIGLGCSLILSCILWVRNSFGLWALGSEGIFLLLCGWKLPAVWLDNLYNFLAATCCLNAVESIQDLFGAGNYMVGGEEYSTTDAHTVADKWGGDYRIWATVWLCLSFVMTAVGILFAFDAKELKTKDTRATNAVTLSGPTATASTTRYTGRPSPSAPLPPAAAAPATPYYHIDYGHTNLPVAVAQVY